MQSMNTIFYIYGSNIYVRIFTLYSEYVVYLKFMFY